MLAQIRNKTDKGNKNHIQLMMYYRVSSRDLESSRVEETRIECSNEKGVAPATSDKEIPEKESGDSGAT